MIANLYKHYYRQPKGFLMFPGGREIVQWEQMG